MFKRIGVFEMGFDLDLGSLPGLCACGPVSPFGSVWELGLPPSTFVSELWYLLHVIFCHMLMTSIIQDVLGKPKGSSRVPHYEVAPFQAPASDTLHLSFHPSNHGFRFITSLKPVLVWMDAYRYSMSSSNFSVNLTQEVWSHPRMSKVFSGPLHPMKHRM